MRISNNALGVDLTLIRPEQVNVCEEELILEGHITKKIVFMVQSAKTDVQRAGKQQWHTSTKAPHSLSQKQKNMKHSGCYFYYRALFNNSAKNTRPAGHLVSNM